MGRPSKFDPVFKAKVAVEALQEGASPLTFSYWQLKPYKIIV